MAKIYYEDVKKEVEEAGWELLSKEYVNLKTDLELKCPEGHLTYLPYSKFRGGSLKCPICKQNQYYQTDNIPVKKTGYRILAFDQASITSGWAVFDNGKLIKYGHWTSEGKGSTERISKTKYWFVSMLNQWAPDTIILEDIQLQHFGEGEEAVLTYKKLAHLQGVLKNYLYEMNYDYKVVPPATWRAASQVKGKTRIEKKKNAQVKVKNLYDVSVSQDEADAILIGKWAVAQHQANDLIEF